MTELITKTKARNQSASQSISSLMAETWRYRHDRLVESCLESFARLKNKLGISFNLAEEQDPETLVGQHTTEHFLEFLVLHASIQRMLQQHAESRKILIWVKKKFLESGEIPSSRCLHELGISAYASGNYLTALDYFVEAGVKSEDPYLQFQSTLNSYFCLENLGINRDNSWKKVQLIAKRLEKENKFPTSDRALIRCCEYREQFRNGKFKELKKSVKNSTPSSAYEQYWLSWVQEIPYFSSITTNDSSLHNKTNTLHDSGFRLQTLRGLCHPANSSQRPSELIDRIYLWTWWWLVSPDRIPVAKVLSQLNLFAFEKQIDNLTIEDRLMLRNILSWFSVFSPSSQESLKSKIDLLRVSTPSGFEVFEFEYLLAEWCCARNSQNLTLAQDLYHLMASHPLWNSAELQFGAIARFIHNEYSIESIDQSLRNFAQILQKLSTQGANHVETEWLLDLRQMRATHLETGEQIQSIALVKSAELLSRYSVITCQELMNCAFGLPHFDEIRHYQKVQNLVARLRKLLQPYVSIRYKNNRIYATGSWSAFTFTNAEPMARELLNAQQAQGILNSPDSNSSQTKFVIPETKIKTWTKSLGKTGFSRSDAESALSLPRSTVNRLLSELVQSGSLNVIGKGRKTRYENRRFS